MDDMNAENSRKVSYNVCDFGVVGDGQTLCTVSLQSALDAAGETCGEVVVPKGIYRTGALFVRSNTSLRLESGAVLLGSQNESDFPLYPSRTAGIEMQWPAALVNIRNAKHVRIYGEGTIDGNGAYWWSKYWELRPLYEEQGLRWAADYDCTRPENLLIYDSSDIIIEGITLRRSGFWNLHLCYSRDLIVRNIAVRDNDGPSTDGIDIDSCNGVLIECCEISCNDDNICLKAGRDADGLRVSRPCENVTIRDNRLHKGEGLTIGSETSGGIRHIRMKNNTFQGTNNGFRMKSSRTRGGIVEDIVVDGMALSGVGTVFNFDFDWYSAYSVCRIPPDYRGIIPKHWNAMTKPVPPDLGLPHARDIHIRNVHAENCGEAMRVRGLAESPFQGVSFENMYIAAKRWGDISHMDNPAFLQTEYIVDGGDD